MNKSKDCLKSGLLFLVFCFLASASGLLHAGAPLKINFQGRLEESGQPAEGTKNFVFKLYDALSAGSLVWTSQAQSVPVTNGVFSVLLETGAPVNLSTGVFSGARYVEITVDGVPLSPRQEMASAPYAMVAQSLAPDSVLSLSNLEKDPSSASVINTSTNAVDWTQLKNVPAGLADGTDEGGATTFSTAAIVSGKFSDERIAISTGAFYGGFNAASQLVQLDPSGNLPVLDGSALTNVNSASMGALTAQVSGVAASTGTLTVNLAAVAFSTGPLANSGNWNTAFGWGNHATAAYASLASTQSFTGFNTFIATAAFTAQSGTLPGVSISSGLVVLGGRVGVSTAAPNSLLTVAGAMSLPVKTISFSNSPYTAKESDSTILVDATGGNITIALPSAAGIAGRIYTVKRVDDPMSGTLVYIAPFGAQTIDGSSPWSLSSFQWEVVILQSDGNNWVLLSM